MKWIERILDTETDNLEQQVGNSFRWAQYYKTFLFFFVNIFCGLLNEMHLFTFQDCTYTDVSGSYDDGINSVSYTHLTLPTKA